MRERGSKLPFLLIVGSLSCRSPCGSVDRNASMKAFVEHISVAPRAGAWIETPNSRRASQPGASLPVRERGSKLFENGLKGQPKPSLPVRERGSKLGSLATVAPGAGGRSPCGSVDRNPRESPDSKAKQGRSPCGSVDRNWNLTAHDPLLPKSLPVRERGSKHLASAHQPVHSCRSPCGSVDRNAPVPPISQNARSRSPCGSVDRNLFGWRRGKRDASSLPVRERGSKHDLGVDRFDAALVAPRAGAWIETRAEAGSCTGCELLPVRERGSKLCRVGRNSGIRKSLPVRERGSKPLSLMLTGVVLASLPVRERGSKPFYRHAKLSGRASLPVRERGSKPGHAYSRRAARGRSPCGSVDRNRATVRSVAFACRRSPCGSVDRNKVDVANNEAYASCSPCGSVDRNHEAGDDGLPG